MSGQEFVIRVGWHFVKRRGKGGLVCWESRESTEAGERVSDGAGERVRGAEEEFWDMECRGSGCTLSFG